MQIFETDPKNYQFFLADASPADYGYHNFDKLGSLTRLHHGGKSGAL